MPVLVALGGCGDDGTGPDANDWGPGTYEAEFEVSPSPLVPDGLEGRHEFTFRVREPGNVPADVDLLSSSLSNVTATNDYLSPERDGVLMISNQWRIQFRYRGDPAFGVRLTMADDGDGGFDLPFGCRAIRGDLENFDATTCRVERVR